MYRPGGYYSNCPHVLTYARAPRSRQAPMIGLLQVHTQLTRKRSKQIGDASEHNLMRTTSIKHRMGNTSKYYVMRSTSKQQQLLQFLGKQRFCHEMDLEQRSRRENRCIQLVIAVRIFLFECMFFSLGDFFSDSDFVCASAFNFATFISDFF